MPPGSGFSSLGLDFVPARIGAHGKLQRSFVGSRALPARFRCLRMTACGYIAGLAVWSPIGFVLFVA